MITVFIVQDIASNVVGVFGDRSDAELLAIERASNGSAVIPKPRVWTNPDRVSWFHPAGGEYFVTAHQIK